jgi:hypothetical protein
MWLDSIPTDNEASSDVSRRQERRKIGLAGGTAGDQKGTRLESRQLADEMLEARKVVLGLQCRLRCCAR